MMARILNSLAVFALMCLTGTALASDANDATHSRRLIEQKIRLIDSLIRAPAASDSAVISTTLLTNGKMLLSQARDALARGQLDDATAALDAAMQNVTRLLTPKAGESRILSDSAQRDNNKTLLEQVSSYRSIIADMVNHGLVSAKPVVDRLDSLQTESVLFSKTGQFSEANRKLAEAYKFAVDSISLLRDGKTVFRSQRFDRPEDNYQYELKRFQSSELLMDILIGEGRADDLSRAVVDRKMREGQEMQSIAQEHAANGDYIKAISKIEQATTRLNDGLQLMGVVMF